MGTGPARVAHRVLGHGDGVPRYPFRDPRWRRRPALPAPRVGAAPSPRARPESGRWWSHWTHAGMLSYGGAKMSKSLGNLVLVRDLLRTYPGDAIRHYLVSRHYRSEVDYSEADLARSAEAAALLRRACLRAEELSPADPALADVSTPASRRGGASARASSPPWTTTSTRHAPCAELDALAALALESPDDPRWRRRRAGWSASSAARILGLRLATVPPCGRPWPHDARPCGRRSRPGQRPPRRGRAAGGPGGLDPPADLGRGARHAGGPGRRRSPGSWSRPPSTRRPALPATYLVATSLAAGAAATGATSRSERRARSPPRSAPACSARWWW